MKVDYLRVPAATLLVAFSAALCISALGLLIGILARTEEQATIFSLIPMFVFAGLGGAWVPLEVTGQCSRPLAIFRQLPGAWMASKISWRGVWDSIRCCFLRSADRLCMRSFSSWLYSGSETWKWNELTFMTFWRSLWNRFVYTKSGKYTDLSLIYSECSGPGGLQLTEFMAEKMQLRAGACLLLILGSNVVIKLVFSPANTMCW